MNFDYQMEKISDELSALTKKVDALASAYQVARDFTKSFLDECEKCGIKCVSIGVRTEDVKSSVTWPFGAEGHVFAGGYKDGWPSIWSAVEAMGIGGGSGNTGEHSIKPEYQAKLVDGVYKLKDGVWERVS